MSVLRIIDCLVDRIGKVVSVLVVLIILTMTFEVVARYLFNRPTVWSYDITYMMGGVFFLFSASFVLLHRGHVRVDLFYTRFSPRFKSLVDVILTPLLLFTAYGVLTQQAWRFAFRALEVGETSMAGIWGPTTIPLRFLIAVGFSLLALEGVIWFMRELLFLFTGRKIGEKNNA